MKIAIVHYHLDLGGVSQTIRSTSALLTARGVSHVVLCGSDPEPLGDLPFALVSGLN